jgi:D-aminopeptidase
LTLGPPVAHRVHEGARLAIERHRADPIWLLRWEGSYVLEKLLFHTHVADAAAIQLGSERVDAQTVRLYGEDILDIIYR